MPRIADPACAERIATSVSKGERQTLDRLARAQRVNLATIVRWAVVEYIARTEDTAQARVAVAS